MRVTLTYRGRYHVREALDLETLASVLRAGGHEVAFVYDPDTFGVTDNVLQFPAAARWLADEEGTIRRLAASRPEAAVFSVLPGTFAWARRTAAALKARTRVPVIFLGLHPSLVPRRVMREECVDYAVAGEAEGVINPLLAAIAACADPGGVGNLWFRRGGQARFTFPAALVDLDALPLPDKGLFAPFVSHHYSYPAMVSRGCPFQCSFCEETCAKRPYGPRYFRRKSPSAVMRELLAGKRRSRFREVIFKDSYMGGDRRWLAELMDRYRREIAVPFKCFCTIRGFDAATAALLKEGGCYSVEFGLQTWNDRLRREVLNRRETRAEAFAAFAHCDRAHLRYDIDHMFNLPTETRRDHVEGAACYRRLKCLGRVKVHHLVYLPTADIVSHGLAAGDLDEGAPERLEDGQDGDFYGPSAGRTDQRELTAAYAALYKLLPLLPEAAVRWLLEGDRVLPLRHVPAVAMAAIQGLQAIRCGDRRFLAYLQEYPAKVWWSVRQRLRREA